MDFSPYKHKMTDAIGHLEKQYAGLQVGRATSGLVDSIPVTVSYGTMPINQVANVVVLDNTTIKIEPRDKSVCKDIESAIYDANTGLTPRNEGPYLMISIPPLTQERRQEIAKQVKQMGEDTKVRVRQIRQDCLKDIKKLHDDKEVSDDQKKGHENNITNITKEFNTKIDDHVKNKSNEVLNG